MAASGDLGYTVSLERGMARMLDSSRRLDLRSARADPPGQAEPVPMVLRVTHVHRRIDSRWRIVHRHADPITEKTPPEAVLRDQAS